MTKTITRILALLCLAGLFTSCMFFPKADPSKRFAGISAVKTDSAEDILNDMEIEDDEIFAVKVSQEASVTATTEANLFGVYPTYILVKVRPADAKTASVSIYRRRNADYDPELIVDHVSAGQSVFEDYIESARAFETYEYKTIVTLKNGTDISSEWITGYGALTPERLFFVMNDEVGSSHKKFPDFGKAKVTTNNASGYRNGSARYEVQIKGLGGTAYITYDNYCDYRLNISGSCNTDSDMGGNGNMWGTLVVSGMYHGSCGYDSITVRSKNAAAGTYLVTTAGVQKRLIYNISDTAPSKSNLITLTASTNTEPQEGEVPNILGVYPITLTWNVDEDFQTGSTLKILRRTMEETTGRVIYDAPVENGSVFADLFDGDMQQPQTFYQYQAQLYKSGSLQDKTRWESGIGYLPPITMTVTASQGTSPEGSEPNEFGIFPISVTYDVPLESSLLDNATYTLVRRLKDSDETRTVLFTGSEHSGSLTDVNNEAMFGQEFEYCIEITNADGQLIRRSEWVTGYGDRLPLGMELTVSDNADNLDGLTPNRYGAYPVTLQYALVSVDDSLTDLTYTLRRRNEETGVEEMLMTEAVEGSQGVFTDTTADARRILNRSWAYAVELHAGDILMYRTDWITVEPVLVPATLTLTASDNKENMDIAADRFGVTPVTLTWNWESDAEFLEDSCYVKVYYKPADDLTGTAIPDAPAGLEGQYTMNPDTAAYQYKADLVYPNGKKTSVIATTDWTEAVDPYIISFGFDPITVSNNDGNLTLEPNQYGVNPFTISWNWNSEKPFLQEGSYFTLTRRSADNVETVLLNKEAGCRDPQLVYTDLISDAKRSGNRMFAWKADLYTAQDELLSTTGWSAAATSWIVPVDCSMTVSKARVTEDMPEANSYGTYPVYLDFSMNDFYYTHSLVTIQRRIKNGEGVYTEFVLNLDNENHGMYESDYADSEPTVIYQYRATVKSLDGVTMKETDWVDGYGAVEPDVFFTEWLETYNNGLSKLNQLWKDFLEYDVWPIYKHDRHNGDVHGTVKYNTMLSCSHLYVVFDNYCDTGVTIDGTFDFKGSKDKGYNAEKDTLSFTNADSGYNGKLSAKGMHVDLNAQAPLGNYTAIIGEFTQQYTQDGQLVYTAD